MIEQKILEHLSSDEKMKTVIESTQLTYSTRDTDDVYYSLIRAIVGQQLSTKAAQTIFGRFINLFEDGYPHPQELMDTSFEDLRSVGLSKQKSSYVQNVAMFFHQNNLLDNDWSMYSDDYIIEMLTEIKGVGKWTVQMILIFSLHREDIFPIDDLAIRQSMFDLYEIPKDLKGKPMRLKLTKIAEGWKPYRSIASRYLWKWRG